MKTTNRLAYFLDDRFNFFIMYLITVGFLVMVACSLTKDKEASQVNIIIALIIMVSFVLIPFLICLLADRIVDEDLEK